MRFAGYAALFDRVDRGGDLVRPGAFAGAPAEGLPLLWQHDPRRPIGRVESLGEDGRGLRVIARVSRASAAGREAAALLSERAVDGLSFGYRVKRASGTAPRQLHEVDVVEISLVTLPMQPAARVHAIEEEQE